MASIRGLLQKYKVMPVPLKASLWFTISNILLRGISFITLPLFSRMLSTDEMGVVTIYQSWITLLSMFVTLNVWTGGFNVGLTTFDCKKDEFAASAQGLGMTISLVCCAISVIFMRFISKWMELPPILTFFVFVQMVFIVPVNVWTQKKRYEFSYKAVISLSTIVSIVNPLLGFILVRNISSRDFARVLGLFIVEMVIGLVCFVMNTKEGKVLFNKSVWKYMFSFNIVLLPHYISAQILNQSDRVMISKMCGKAEAGIYGVAYTFAMLMALVTSGIESVISPYTFRSLKSGRIVELRKTIILSLYVIVVGAIVLMCIIPDIFMFMLPKDYHNAIYIIPIVVCAAYFQYLYPIFSNIELFYNEKQFITIASCVGAGANIGLNYIFIKHFGFVAAAYTTLFCYILFCILHYFFMCKVLKRNNSEKVYNIGPIVLLSLGLLIATFIILSLYSNSYVRYGVMATVLFILVMKRKTVSALIKNSFNR